MPYPFSSEVSAGQPTAAAHYNNLRKDALYFGNAAADSLTPGAFLSRFAQNLSLVYLATNRIRVPFIGYRPCILMINGYALKATADIDLPAGMFSGVAALWYVFAVRSPGSTTFTITVNTSPVEAPDHQMIGFCYWDGAVISSIQCFFANTGLAVADYDSGWFAVVANTSYTKTHGLTAFARVVMLFHSTDSAGASEWVLVSAVQGAAGAELTPIGWTSTAIIASSSSGAGATCQSTRRVSAVGYWRILAWI